MTSKCVYYLLTNCKAAL